MGGVEGKVKIYEVTKGFGSCSRNGWIVMSRLPHLPMLEMTFFGNGDESSLFKRGS